MRPSPLDPVALDRAAGVLVGAAAGDALGAGYEFAMPPPSPEEILMRRGRLTGRPAGSWTDDTDMAIAIAQVVASGSGLASVPAVNAVGERFLDWYRAGPSDIGAQTRVVLGSVRTASELTTKAADYSQGNEWAAGNGSLMRTGPVALGHLGNDKAIVLAARAVSSLTHADLRAQEACVLWSIAIDRAVREARLDGIGDGLALLPDARQAFWTTVIEQAQCQSPETFSPNGYVVAAFQAAWAAIWATRCRIGAAHLEAGLRTAVSIGNDTDTVAAIAGSLLGARYGASAVPFAWRRRLGGWPHDLGHRDLVALGVLGARGGQPDGTGWPTTDDLMPHYRRGWNPPGHAVALPADPWVLWGDIGALATVDADAFVSLCRIGAAQRRGPEHHEVWLIDQPGEHANCDLRFVLEDTADAVAQLRVEGRKVFVHCVMAETRTPIVAMTWLIRHHGTSAPEAEAMVRESMPWARPNPKLADVALDTDRSAR